MAQFKEELVINALHADKAEVGKKYWVSDKLVDLKDMVEIEGKVFKLKAIMENHNFPFVIDSIEDTLFQFLYPYEEPPKKRMSYRQLAEWLAKGNGQYTTGGTIYHNISYNNCDIADEHTLKEYYKIRHWDSEEWIEPTVDIYERDCKGGKE